MNLGFLQVKPNEGRGMTLAFLYFFFLMCSYYILRPIRDEMGVTSGLKNLPWLFTGTFVVIFTLSPVFALLMSRFKRKIFIPLIYYLVTASLLLFYILFEIDSHNVFFARIFFVWISVYVMFVVSVFWSFMLDLFSGEQAKRLFGVIAAGGSCGALIGPTINIVAIPYIGVTNLLLVSASLLFFATMCIHGLLHWHASLPNPENQPQHTPNKFDTMLDANVFSIYPIIRRSTYLMGVVLFIFLLTVAATFLYFEQAAIAKHYFPARPDRTLFFTRIDLWTNLASLTLQLLVTANVIRWLKLSGLLLLMPFLLGLGFLWLGFAPILLVLVVVQVLRRAGEYAFIPKKNTK